jgi:hypothetical protein
MSDSRGADPGDHNEAVGDADPVKATGWGIQSIKQIVPLLIPATVRDGQDFDDLSDGYGRVIGQWATELTHVADVVAGADAQEKYAGQAGPRYRPLPRARQVEAVKFLNDNAFATPRYFLVDDILRRIEVEGAIRRINAAQARVLGSLLNDRKLERLIDYEALATNKSDVYTLVDLARDVRTGVFSELSAGGVQIDPYRRELQRTLITQMGAKINPPPAPAAPGGPGGGFGGNQGPARVTSDVRAVFRAELRALDADLRSASGRTRDAVTRAHIEDARDRIAKILDPK